MEPPVDPERAGTDNKNVALVEDYSVWWNEPADQDPENPMSWAKGRKWGIIAIISFLSFLT